MSESTGRLRGGAIGALGAAVISMAFMGPATSVAFNTAPGAAKTGYALPVGIFLALLVCLITASTIGAFSRKLPSAGFAFTFNSHAFGKGAGFVSGWILVLAYGAIGPMLFSAMGSFGSQFLADQFHWHVPWWVISAAVLLIIWFIGSRGITSSVKAALIFLVLELGVLLALFGTIIGEGGESGNSLSPFNPGLSLTGAGGIGFGMLWGILMFVGFESAGTLGEETRDPRRNVPRALFAAVIMIGLVYVLSGYAASIGFGQAHVGDLASDSSPWTTLSDRYWGKQVAWVLTLTVLNSQFANALSGSTAAVRIIFSLGREGLLSPRLAKTNSEDSPVAAWAAYIVFSAVVTFVIGWLIGPLGTYGLLGSLLGLGIVVIYILMNIGLIRYFWRQHRDEFSFLRHGVLPVAGSLLMLLPIYGLLWPVPDAPYNLVPYLLLAWALLGIGYFAYVRRNKPAVVEAMGRVWEPVEPVHQK
ncbi:MAG TPA: APC family permease [Pseudonocardiaceae bacterium]|jgi:amino acid transporter|nr:APC family permease [Pseudonocardiaceae bacterium]